MKKLKPITYDPQLSEFDVDEAVSLRTLLMLDDYDWMQYVFKTWFPTKKQGYLAVKIEYNGFKDAEMTVTQNAKGQAAIHTIAFDSKIFTDMIRDFMADHLRQWEEGKAFSYEKKAVETFNRILEAQKTYEIRPA